MVELIWTESALRDLEAIAEYIALDKREAAQSFVRRVFEKWLIVLSYFQSQAEYHQNYLNFLTVK